MNHTDKFKLETASLKIHACEVIHDAEIFGFKVASIQSIEIYNANDATKAFEQFEEWVNVRSVDLVSCRLPHDRITSSMFLEKQGFRFIEMVLHPTLGTLQSLPLLKTELRVEPVSGDEVSVIASLAERSFSFERYHADPRIDSKLADKRYGKWINNSFRDEKQVLLKIMHLNDLVGFFVIENKPEGLVYWHLTAINPELKGQKMGTEVWKTMMVYHRTAGMESILTTISARNTPVLNLYSKLNFRFYPPEITLHWLRGDQ